MAIPSYDTLSDNELVVLLGTNQAVLRVVRKRTAEYSLNFLRKMYPQATDDMLTDVYHDALIILYEKARDGALVLTASLQTYLNAICRFQLLNRLRREGKQVPVQAIDDDVLPSITDKADDVNDEESERIAAIVKGLERMKGKGDCYDLLMMVYYGKQPMKAVAQHFGYSSEQVAKNKSFHCRETLRTLAQTFLRKLL
jgi:RNA polymerase sigma factor (sigma-70 family)